MEKHLKECLARREAAAVELQEQEPDLSAEQVTHSLVYGLNTLRNLLFQRIHEDVEANYGHDSMLLPISVEASERVAKCEIETYQIAVTALTIQERGFLRSDVKWFVKWLAELRLMSEDAQRLDFSRHLETVFPEASRAPLILYRLFPLSIRIVSAVAFGHHLEAAELRNRQTFWLPAIGDCHDCHGRPLDNGEQCPVCGNPIWTYHWLCAD
jgi:hypothetical protein